MDINNQFMNQIDLINDQIRKKMYDKITQPIRKQTSFNPELRYRIFSEVCTTNYLICGAVKEELVNRFRINK